MTHSSAAIRKEDETNLSSETSRPSVSTSSDLRDDPNPQNTNQRKDLQQELQDLRQSSSYKRVERLLHDEDHSVFVDDKGMLWSVARTSDGNIHIHGSDFSNEDQSESYSFMIRTDGTTSGSVQTTDRNGKQRDSEMDFIGSQRLISKVERSKHLELSPNDYNELEKRLNGKDSISSDGIPPTKIEKKGENIQIQRLSIVDHTTVTSSVLINSDGELIEGYQSLGETSSSMSFSGAKSELLSLLKEFDQGRKH